MDMRKWLVLEFQDDFAESTSCLSVELEIDQGDPETLSRIFLFYHESFYFILEID